jgi:hypothetical protein
MWPFPRKKKTVATETAPTIESAVTQAYVRPAQSTLNPSDVAAVQRPPLSAQEQALIDDAFVTLGIGSKMLGGAGVQAVIPLAKLQILTQQEVVAAIMSTYAELGKKYGPALKDALAEAVATAVTSTTGTTAVPVVVETTMADAPTVSSNIGQSNT